MKVLDVGCGSGQDAEHYAKEGAQVCGIDISKEEIAMAQQHEWGQFRVGTMNDLPYEANTFDLVTSVYALQTSENVPEAITEMIRVAKPEAPIIIATKHPIRNLLEGHINDHNGDYFTQKYVTSHIFQGKITLSEPSHTMMDYLSPCVLEKAKLSLFEEHIDYPASAQVIPGMKYPTYMILKYIKP